MRLSKKKEHALELAIDVMSACLSNGMHLDDAEFEEAVNELIDLHDSSLKARMRANQKKAVKNI